MSDRWPNLFIPGVEKGGTTSLWQHLDAHPDVFMSEVKEPSFFIPDRHEAAKTEARYLSLFEGREEAWLGEASVRYFYDELAPGRIREAAPDGRILIILRNPVDRAYSAYWGTVRSGYERRSFQRRSRSSSGAGRRSTPRTHARRTSDVATTLRLSSGFSARSETASTSCSSRTCDRTLAAR